MNKLHEGGPGSGESSAEPPDGLAELEPQGSALDKNPSPKQVADYQLAQRKLWVGLRSQGNPWLITDFAGVGTPIYMADKLLTKNRNVFDTKRARWELPTSPPESDGRTYNNISEAKL